MIITHKFTIPHPTLWSMWDIASDIFFFTLLLLKSLLPLFCTPFTLHLNQYRKSIKVQKYNYIISWTSAFVLYNQNLRLVQTD